MSATVLHQTGQEVQKILDDSHDISNMIPEEASSENKLADKNFVGTEVATKLDKFVQIEVPYTYKMVIPVDRDKPYLFRIIATRQDGTVNNELVYIYIKRDSSYYTVISKAFRDWVDINPENIKVYQEGSWPLANLYVSFEPSLSYSGDTTYHITDFNENEITPSVLQNVPGDTLATIEITRLASSQYVDDIASDIDSQISNIDGRVQGIEDVIPSSVDPNTNQLADKAWVSANHYSKSETYTKSEVDQKIQTETATFQGNYDTWSDVPDSYRHYPSRPNNNDYMVVRDASGYAPEWSDEESYSTGDIVIYTLSGNDYELYKALLDIVYSGEPLPSPEIDSTHWELVTNNPNYKGTWRFKYIGDWNTKFGWHPEYQINEEPLTPSQIAALDSGITAAKVTKLDALPTNSELQNTYMPKSGGTFTDDVNIDEGNLYVKGQISVEGGEILMTDDPVSDMAAINKGYVDNALSTKYTKPSDGIPKADLAIDVQNSLQKKYTVETIDADQYLVITRSESYGVYDTIMVIINIYDTVDTILITGLTSNGNLHAVIVGPNYGIYPNIVENDYGVAIQVKDVCSGAQVIDFVGDVVDSVYVEDSFNIHEEYPIEEYQDKLISGTNIKTINNTSLLGSGNIQISADTSDCVKFGEAINASNGYLTIYGDETFALMLVVVLDDEVSTYIVRGNQSPTVSAEKIEGVDSFQYAKRDDENGTLALRHEDSLYVTPILLSGTMPTITDLSSASGEDEEIQSFQIGKELPSGGTAGQVLAKASGTDYDVEWANGGGEEIDTVAVSVDNNTGTPSATGSVSGSTLSLSFHNLKGATGAAGATGPQGPQGPKGDKGDQGNTGSSVSYPYELVNNLTTNDATKGLSAAQGVVLSNKIDEVLSKSIEQTGLDTLTLLVDDGAIGFEQGSINSSGGITGSAARIRTQTAISTKIRWVGVPDGYQINQVTYYSAWASNTDFTFVNNVAVNKRYVELDETIALVRLLIKKTDGTNFTPSDFIASLKLLSPKIIELQSNVDDVNINTIGTQFPSREFVNAGLSSGNLSSIKYRIASNHIWHIDTPIELVADSGFRFGIHYFVNGVYTSESGWQTQYIIPDGSSFKIVIARTTEITTETADIPLFAGAVKFFGGKSVLSKYVNPNWLNVNVDIKQKTNGCGSQGLTKLVDKYIQFNASADDHSTTATLIRWDEDFTQLASMTHNLGHAATCDYSEESNTLIVGNGSASTSVLPRVDLITDAYSKITSGGSLNYADALHIELSTQTKAIGGTGLICCFGGNWRIVYLATGQGNEPRRIFRCILGVGAEDFSDQTVDQTDVMRWGTFISGKTNSEYNGTLKVLSVHPGPETQVYQGMCFRAGFIYLACGLNEPLVHKIRLTNDSFRIVQTNKPLKYNPDGTQVTMEPQGLCFADSSTMLIGLPSYGGLFAIDAF